MADYQPLSCELSCTATGDGHPLALSTETERRCKSASEALQCGHHRPGQALSRAQLLDEECISLPGQISLEAVSSDAVRERAKSLGMQANSNDTQSVMKLNGKCDSNVETVSSNVSASKNFTTQQDTAFSRSVELDGLMKDTENDNRCKMVDEHSDMLGMEGSPCVEPYSESVGKQHFKEGNMTQSDSKVQLLSSQQSLRSSLISGDLSREFSNLSNSSDSESSLITSSFESTIEICKQKVESTQPSRRSNTRPIILVLYVICAILVYPILLFLLPFMLTFKLVSLLCCCIPCYRKKQRRTAGKQGFPLFFSSHPGGYHTVAIELKEQMEAGKFVDYVIGKLDDVYCMENSAEQNMVFRLASAVRWIACFSLWELHEEVNLEEHVQIVNKRITTTLNFTDFVEQLSKSESSGARSRSRKKLWQLYYFPFFKTKSSSILLRVHHSVLSRVNLKDLLLYVFSDGPEMLDCERTQYNDMDIPFAHPNFLEIFLTAPGIVLKHILRPSLSLFLKTNRLRFAYSAPLYLHEAQRLAHTCDISLHAVFMAPLSQTLRNILPQKYPFGRVNVMIPVAHSTGHNSAFFVNLPLTKQTWERARLQQLDKDIHYSNKESQVLLSAAKLAALALSPCTVDFLASSIVRGADVLFRVVLCPSYSHRLDDYVISSVMYWPPLFDHVSMSVCVVIYEKSIRVCVATDYSITEWPDLLLKHYVSSYSELYRLYCT